MEHFTLTKALYVLKIELLKNDPSKPPTRSLKVAKWQNAFQGDPPTVKNNFVDLDPGSFYVRVTDPSCKGAGKISINVSTDSPSEYYDDNPTEVELAESPAGSGVFLSESMMLMSDSVDDEHKVGGIEDDHKNDRTHIVALGGKVKVTYVPTSGVQASLEAKVPDPSYLKQTVNIQILIVRDKPTATGGTAPISKGDVETDWKLVRERFAQVGVKINYDIAPAPVDPPDGVDFTDGFKIRDPMSSKVLTEEAKKLISGLGTVPQTGDIHVLYVETIYGALSTAVADYWYEESEDPYTFNIILRKDRGVFDPAHELGHILTDKGYGTTVPKTNLMHEKQYDGNTVTTMKRLDSSQETRIRGRAPHVQ